MPFLFLSSAFSVSDTGMEYLEISISSAGKQLITPGQKHYSVKSTF